MLCGCMVDTVKAVGNRPPTARQPAAIHGRRVGEHVTGYAVASGVGDSSDGFRIELLGPVEAWMGGRAVALGGQRPRALFAVLALLAGHVVTVDRLIDEL